VSSIHPAPRLGRGPLRGGPRSAILFGLALLSLALAAGKANRRWLSADRSPRELAMRRLARAGGAGAAATARTKDPLFSDVAPELGVRFIHDNAEPDALDMLQLQAQIAINGSDPATARRSIETALGIDRLSSRSHELRGRLLFLEGGRRGSNRSSAPSRLDPKATEARFVLALMWQQSGAPERARGAARALGARADARARRPAASSRSIGRLLQMPAATGGHMGPPLRHDA
jgi:hypothetical protein